MTSLAVFIVIALTDTKMGYTTHITTEGTMNRVKKCSERRWLMVDKDPVTHNQALLEFQTGVSKQRSSSSSRSSLTFRVPQGPQVIALQTFMAVNSCGTGKEDSCFP
ncbi:hypothetical protein JTE90_000106 [Oedothorax gibbosus]|uniref:Uncharacterized protein n=1 Tax=Oedothorax gibbosus TaxID=931172 RepID=A0AAV6V1U5_9ARAC|nr:hypothetical protein JTE90_000106 [Oedothorax gibbosus]